MHEQLEISTELFGEGGGLTGGINTLSNSLQCAISIMWYIGRWDAQPSEKEKLFPSYAFVTSRLSFEELRGLKHLASNYSTEVTEVLFQLPGASKTSPYARPLHGYMRMLH